MDILADIRAEVEEISALPGRCMPMVADIQLAVAEVFEIPLHEMFSARRAREVARPRQVAMYLAKQLTYRSLPEIGRYFGGRDHTTVIHAVKQIERLSEDQPELLEMANRAIHRTVEIKIEREARLCH